MEWLILLLGMFFFIRFTIVKEGTAKALMKLGAFSEIFFQWQKHWIDIDWNVWKEGEGGKKKKNWAFGKIFGGLYFYIWPFYSIYKYPLRWTDLRRVEEAEEKVGKPQFHDEKERDHVMLKAAVYWTKVFQVETRPPERIPLNIEILMTIRIINPYRFLFVAPPTPLEDVFARIEALMRSRITSLFLDEILYLKGKSEVLWHGEEEVSGLKEEKFIKETLPKWGMEIAEQGIDMKKIDLSPDYQKAAAAEKEKQMQSSGRAEEIMGTIISSVVIAEGVEKEEVQKEFKKSPIAFYKRHKPIVDNTMSKLAIEGKASVRIETPGASGLKGDFLDLIAAFKRMPTGGSEEAQKEKKEKTEEREEKEEGEEKTKLSKEEIKKKMEEAFTGEKKKDKEK